MKLMVPAVAVLCLGGGQASANGLPVAGNGIRSPHELSGAELKVLQNEQRMLQYQKDHQRFMEDLRRVPSAEQPRPDVPRLQRNCQTPVYGSKWVKRCR